MICPDAQLAEAIVDKLQRVLIPLSHRVSAVHVLDGTQNLLTYCQNVTPKQRTCMFLLNLEASFPKKYQNLNRINQEPKYALAKHVDDHWLDIMRVTGVTTILVTGEESESIMEEHAPHCYEAVANNYTFRFYTVEKDGELVLSASKSGNIGEWCEACQVYH